MSSVASHMTSASPTVNGASNHAFKKTYNLLAMSWRPICTVVSMLGTDALSSKRPRDSVESLRECFRQISQTPWLSSSRTAVVFASWLMIEILNEPQPQPARSQPQDQQESPQQESLSLSSRQQEQLPNRRGVDATAAPMHHSMPANRVRRAIIGRSILEKAIAATIRNFRDHHGARDEDTMSAFTAQLDIAMATYSPIGVALERGSDGVNDNTDNNDNTAADDTAADNTADVDDNDTDDDMRVRLEWYANNMKPIEYPTGAWPPLTAALYDTYQKLQSAGYFECEGWEALGDHRGVQGFPSFGDLVYTTYTSQYTAANINPRAIQFAHDAFFAVHPRKQGQAAALSGYLGIPMPAIMMMPKRPESVGTQYTALTVREFQFA
ncbi:Uu.00g093440.m01.CDS01 [Anthostomella pinea]|uniref:Uu.00g093440.m01.CDS01 n=1 Tax=Anthostomella pinea TaxID=933095 RepID=A0AAI8VNJ3_9PEZI|nr:Uu.00g093440.m01.CDS01 [Anthostomella pinea]